MKRLLLALAMMITPAPTLAQEAAPAAVDYRSDANWLCLPGRADPCGRPLPTAALNPNGYGSVGQSVPAEDPPIDCFYVYPTISRDAALNSDMSPGIEEQGAAMVQFARFAGVCRTFAPVYRQATMASIGAAMAGQDMTAVLDSAYRDVKAAWQDYLQNRNQGRPFILIGHSQGAIHLSRLLAEEIEGKEVAGRMLSAMLIGWAVEVPEGQRVGGTFQSTPLCSRVGETGCVVTYMSFRAASPPPAGSLLGRATHPGMTAGCTNPAALGGGSAPLDSYWFALPVASPGITWSSEGPPPVPFLRTEGLVSGECVHNGPVGYLAITVNADPADARTDQIPGDTMAAGRPLPGWGLHPADMNLALGDLIHLVEAQRDSFARRR